jgi:hypothetical protein
MESVVKTATPLKGIIDPRLPTLFVDGVANAVNTKETVKITFFRTDGDIGDSSRYENVGVCQLVLTRTAFINTLVFFEKLSRNLLAGSIITEQELETARKAEQGRS